MITLAALVTLASFPVTGTVSGRVMDGRNTVANAVVWLDGPVKSTPKSATVDQRKKTFVPHIQVVTVGSRVDFPNDDDVFHNVFAEFQAKRFDLGMYPKGASKSVTFDKPGIVSVLCNVHASMSAYVVVVDTPYYAVTDAKGRFAIKGVTNRTYTLKAWHESGRTGRQEVAVSADTEVTVPIAK